MDQPLQVSTQQVQVGLYLGQLARATDCRYCVAVLLCLAWLLQVCLCELGIVPLAPNVDVAIK